MRSSSYASILLCVLLCSACAGTTYTERTETRVEHRAGNRAITVEETSINDQKIQSLRAEWKTEYVIATGSVPVIDKYNDPARDRALARRGAILDAQRNMAQKVGAIRITETVTMADLSTTDFVRSELDTILRNTEVLTERYDETNKLYEVVMRMPKVRLVKVVEEYNRRSIN